MLNLDDTRWQALSGGYRIPFDPRPFLLKLEAQKETETAWHELWEGLHHQGDVGEASYAAIPRLVRIYRQNCVRGWNTYAILAVVDLARDNGNNPPVPDWLSEDYFRSIRTLAEIGADEIFDEKDPEFVRAVLSVLAIAAGARIHARFVINYSGEELLEIEKLGLERS